MVSRSRGAKMQIARGVATFVSAVALSWSSFAATVMPEQGIVLVNRGNGYQNVTEPTNVKPGDILVVNPGGSAQLAYDDGCFVPVAVGLIVTVGAESPCTMQGSLTPAQASGPPPMGPGPYPGDSSAPQGGARCHRGGSWAGSGRCYRRRRLRQRQGQAGQSLMMLLPPLADRHAFAALSAAECWPASQSDSAEDCGDNPLSGTPVKAFDAAKATGQHPAQPRYTSPPIG
jgi:hypothetical protein